MPLTAIGGSTGTVVIGNEGTGFFPEVLHPNVQTYVGAQASVGYIMSVNEIDAVNNLVWSMVGTGIWDKMQIVYPCIGNSTTGGNSFKWNLKDTSTFNITFQGSWTFASTGMQIAAANIANRGLTGYTPNIHSIVGDAHISIYLRNFATGVTPSVFGSYYNLEGGGLITGSQSPIGNINTWVQNAVSPSGLVSISGFSGGMLIGSRLTSNSVAINTLNGGIRSASLNTGSGVRNSQQIWIGTGQIIGNSTSASPQEIAFASIGFGLTRPQISSFYNIVQAFQTKLGRQV